MASIERRILLRTSATAMAVGLIAEPALAQATGDAKPLVAPPPGEAPSGPPPVPVTHILARYAATAPVEQIPAPVRKEAARTLINWVGCAVGGSRQAVREDAARRSGADDDIVEAVHVLFRSTWKIYPEWHAR